MGNPLGKNTTLLTLLPVDPCIMGRRKKIVQECEKLMDKPEQIRNIAIAAHVDHGKTTLSDNLLAGAGMISDETAGQQLAMDTKEDEQERGITIDAANVSMTHEWEGENHLINLIDTPGHVDFGGDVTRAMRAVDGALVVVDAVEGAMPQTETVLRQALREGVKPTLFINKVDRLITELQEGPEEMQKRLVDVISGRQRAYPRDDRGEGLREDWTVSVEDGTVGFGSALYKWGVSMPSMERTGISFGDIMELERGGDRQELHERTPLSDVVLDMVREHFPNPSTPSRRVPRIGAVTPNPSSRRHAAGQRGRRSRPDGDRHRCDPHAGEIATGRLFSGTIRKGQELYVSGTAGKNRVQSVGVFMGGEREELDRVPAGNIAAVTGLRDAIAGSTVSCVEMTPFESIEHISEPVITKSVEAERMDDLPKLIQTLQQVAKEDPTIRIEINEDTGEHLISGQGELHLEVITQRIRDNQGIPVRTGEPIVVYREQVQGESHEVEGVSPNRHNRSTSAASRSARTSSRRSRWARRRWTRRNWSAVKRCRKPAWTRTLPERRTHPRDEHPHRRHEGYPAPQRDDGTRHRGSRRGARRRSARAEPVQGTLLRLHDARLHEDTIHRGPAQVIPATRDAVHRALIAGQVKLLEPIQNVRIDVPSEYMGSASGEIQGRRGRVDDMYQEGDLMVIEGIAPVEEMIGFSSDVRSATEGRASWNTENAGFRVLSDNLQREKIMEIRERKGMKLELNPAIDYF